MDDVIARCGRVPALDANVRPHVAFAVTLCLSALVFRPESAMYVSAAALWARQVARLDRFAHARIPQYQGDNRDESAFRIQAGNRDPRERAQYSGPNRLHRMDSDYR